MVKTTYPAPISNLVELVGEPLVLLRAVIANYQAMEEPGAEDVITFDGPRQVMVNNVIKIYTRLANKPDYKFPYSQATIIDMHTKFRKLTAERKKQVLAMLNIVSPAKSS